MYYTKKQINKFISIVLLLSMLFTLCPVLPTSANYLVESDSNTINNEDIYIASDSNAVKRESESDEDVLIASDSNATKENQSEIKSDSSSKQLSFYEKLLNTDSLDELYDMILNSSSEDIESLSGEEVQNLIVYVNERNLDEDYEYYDDLIDTLNYFADILGLNSNSSIYETIMESDNLYDIYDIMNSSDEIYELSFSELDNIRDKISVLFYGVDIEDLNEEDSSIFIEIEDMIDHLQYDGGVDTYTTYTRTWTGSVTSFTVASGDTYNVTVTGDTNLSGIIVVNGTLNIKSDGKASHKITRTSGSNMFRVQSGGKLVITGTSTYPLIIEGYDDASYATITCYTSTLDMDYVTMQNQNRTSGYGGAIQFGFTGTTYTCNATLDNVTINNCDAPEGAAMMFLNACAGNIDLTECTIKNCTSTGTYGGTIRTQGSANCKVTIESCTITDNVSVNNGGGVYWNARGSSAHLDITGTASKPTIIQDNEAVYGGGVFLSGQSIEIINTHIIENTGTYGGGICMQPYDYSDTSSGVGCDLIVGSGAKIQDNKSSTYGGGIFMQIDSGSTTDGEDFEIIIEDGALISGNKAKYGGAFAVTQEIGNASYTDGATRKYNSYLKILDGTIYDNSATENGGAFYVSREYGDDGADYELQVDISGGNIYNNTATKYGGAVYLIDDATDSKACVNVSGGTIGSDTESKGNSAVNGGAVYIQGGTFKMSDGLMLNNSASDMGGAVCLYGGDFVMSDGNINYNTSNYGGAVCVTGGNINITGGLIDNNESSKSGGGIYVSSDNNDFTVDIYSGSITNNFSNDSGGGIGIDVDSNSNVAITIGSEPCLGLDESHSHPIIDNNVAYIQGGGLYINGNESNITLDIYCGNFINNFSNYERSSDNVSQTGGLLTWYGGFIGRGLCVTGGTLLDERANTTNVESEITYHPNYDGATDPVKIALITNNVVINLPAYAFVRDGYYLIGWSEIPNPSADEIIPIGADYTVYEDKTLYAIWTTDIPTSNYIVYIPDIVPIGESKEANLDITVELSYFPTDATLDLLVYRDTVLSDNTGIGLSYSLLDDDTLINSGDLITTWSLRNRDSKSLILRVLDDYEYSGDYIDTLTFEIDYTES